MSANDDAGSNQNYSRSNDDAAYFIYTPKDVIHAQNLVPPLSQGNQGKGIQLL